MNLAKKCSYFTALMCLLPIWLIYLEAGSVHTTSIPIVVANLVVLLLGIYSAIVMGLESRNERMRQLIHQRERYNGRTAQNRVRGRW